MVVQTSVAFMGEDNAVSKRDFYNGRESTCPIYENGWDKTAEKIDNIHTAVTSLVDNTAYLQKLDPIANTIKLFAVVIVAIFVLFAVAIGRDVFISKDGLSAKQVSDH